MENHLLLDDVRGVEVFLGVKLVKDGKMKKPASRKAKKA